jgi:hypothetical protein
VTGGALILAVAILAGAPAPDEPVCTSVLSPQLAPGRWGVVRLRIINNSGRPGSPELLQESQSGKARQSLAVGSVLGAGQQREYLLPFRPLTADIPLVVRVNETDIAFPDAVRRPEQPAVVVVGPPGAAAPPLPVAARGRVLTHELPEWAAAYEGVDILVLGADAAGTGGARLSPAQRKALGVWFRAGGRAVVDSPRTLLAYSGVLAAAPAEALPEAKEAWIRLLGGDGSQVLLWEGEKPLIALFRAGFGRGLYVDRGAGGWSPEWVAAAKQGYARLAGGGDARCAPLAEPGLYHLAGEHRDFPRLESSLIGAGAALRWALGAALLVAGVGALAWRRSRPARLAAAAAGAALLAALALALLVPVPAVRALSVRVEEFSPDGKGVRAREYLYLEAASGSPSGLEILAAPGVLPSPVLYAPEEAARVSYSMVEEPRGVFHLTRFSFRERSLFLGAGPLPGRRLVTAPPDARPATREALADCLAGRGERCRPQAEFLAKYLHAALLSGAAEGARVCRLPDDDGGPAMTALPARRVRSVRLGRLGIFYGEER